MNFLGNLLSRLTAVSTFVGAAAIVLMILHVSADVLLRNLFLISIPATGAVVGNYYMAIVSFLPVALAGKLEQHIAVDLVYDRLPNGIQSWNLALVRLIVGVAAGGASYAFLLDAIEKYQFNSYVLELGLRVPSWPGYFMLPIGFGLWSAINFYRLAVTVTGYEDMTAPPVTND